MRKVLFSLISLIILIGILGCATEEALIKICDSWIGAPAEKLIEQWRYPNRTIELADGHIVYVYTRSTTIQMPIEARSYEDLLGNIHTTVSGGETLTDWCNVYFEIDEDGTILKYSYEGNDCTALVK